MAHTFKEFGFKDKEKVKDICRIIIWELLGIGVDNKWKDRPLLNIEMEINLEEY